jgi:uncharacterized repeat protein (TIGR01451 family)
MCATSFSQSLLISLLAQSNEDSKIRIRRVATRLFVLILVAISCCGTAAARNLTLTTGGKVTIEFLFSDASFSNTLSIVSPTAAIAITGCKDVPVSPLPGLHVSSAKTSQRGCRVELDADPAAPGIQPFAAGTTFEFRLCADNNGDGTCNNVWSSNPALNSDRKDHVITTPLHPAEFPGKIFQMAWEDLPNLGDMDFNDFIAVIRVVTDTDGDGLWDDWEMFGVDTDGDSVIDLDLPALGANPNHKDLFIEVDYMDCAVAGGDCAAGDTHSHRPKTAAIQAVINAFANAPVSNPDGNAGINLHVDVSNAIPHQNQLNINGLCFGGGTGIGSFDAVKADPANFGPNNPRRFAYHYSLWTHQQVSTSTASGCGELPGNDFQVSLGGWNVGSGDLDGDGLADADVGTVQQQAGTFMHELGHNLNLGHGGGDGVNFKPNYLSIMSYNFQLSGIPPADPDGTGPLSGRVDYSGSALANLNETSLNEAAGIGDGTDNTFFTCPNGTRAAGVGTGPIDWDCDGNPTGVGITADINGDRICITPGNDGILQSAAAGDDVITGTVIWDGPDRTCNSTVAAASDDVQVRGVGIAQPNPLTGFDDWTNLKLDFQNTGSFEDGDHSQSARVVELDVAVFQQTIMADLSITKMASPATVMPGSNLTYTIIVKNNRPDVATNVTVADNLPASTTFVSCSSTLGGVCGGSGNTRTVTFSSIPGGSSATITLVATVDCTVHDGTTILNTATVSSVPPDADLSNNSATVTTTASNPPPTITGVSANPSVLWPPNHRLVDVTVDYNVTDNCPLPPNSCTLSVTSNEPINGTGDGDTSPDWIILDAHHVQLRAERAGNGNGRIYTITITCIDSGGNSSSESVTVTVPHDRGRR